MYIHSILFFHVNSNEIYVTKVMWWNCCCMNWARSIYNRPCIYLNFLCVWTGCSLWLDMVLSTQTHLFFTYYCWFEVCLLLLMVCSLACSFCYCSVFILICWLPCLLMTLKFWTLLALMMRIILCRLFTTNAVMLKGRIINSCTVDYQTVFKLIIETQVSELIWLCQLRVLSLDRLWKGHG
jgi:hypothetical protein